MKAKTQLISIIIIILALSNALCVQPKGVKVGTFIQDVRTFYSTDDGLPSNDVFTIMTTDKGEVYAGTDAGLAVFFQGKWHAFPETVGKKVCYLATDGNLLAAYSVDAQSGEAKGDIIFIIQDRIVQQELYLPQSFTISVGVGDMDFYEKLLLGTKKGLYKIDYDPTEKRVNVIPQEMGPSNITVQQIAVNEKEIAVAAQQGLYKFNPSEGVWHPVYPKDGHYSWAPIDVGGVLFDRLGRLWFASPQGVGCFKENWNLYTGSEGLPYNAFTKMAAGEQAVVWFGTDKGAIRFDGETWAYRQGLRWLPNDDIRDITITAEGNAWFATANGVAVIEQRPMTLAEKANYYEDAIDRYHRRTPYEYVLEVSLAAPGDKTKWTQHDSDNDGLWTSMYGAGECFAYAATKDPKAKLRAKKAFEAMRFLAAVTQGTKHSPPPGYVARTILPTSGPDPNEGRLERDIMTQKFRDKLWKVYEPRWPVSADGKWYWKTDTSSDELDGHYFLYALYYDLVAETEEEKEAVRAQVKALTDHLIDHNFNLVDHDGKPTRWARFSPEELNFSKNWIVERGLNSLSMLSYLSVAEHVTGDPKYRQTADMLIEKHSYMQNMMNQKFQRGIGTGNQSDDEMAFMAYYNLIKYEKDPERRSNYAFSFWSSWQIEAPEMNPFFNFCYAALCSDESFTNAFRTFSTAPKGDWLDDSIETLKRFPLDRINWRHKNSHRIDIVRIHEANTLYGEGTLKGKGYRVNGKVIPVDECYFNHYNRDPWALNTGGDGRGMGCGTVFLLPYYMGLYHGFIAQ